MAYDFSSGLAALNLGINSLGQGFDALQKRQTLASLGQDFASGNYAAAAGKAANLGELGASATLAGLATKQKQEADWMRANGGALGLGGGADAPQAAAPSVTIGNPTEVENRFIGGVRQAGLTNPIGLGAVAAYGRAESGFSPRNANRTWSDPSESGQAGQAGGIMSWRADRLRNLYGFAQQRGEQPGNISPETQAAFLAQEDPTLIPKLQAAKTPEEANGIMAQAWRFAGYDRSGGENARRLAMTRHYAGRYGQQPAAAPVQVAENEADVQRLEAQMAAQQPPVQVAQAPAQPNDPQSDVRAPGGANVQLNAQGYFIPPGGGVEQSIANNPRVQRLQRALDGAPERFKASIQSRLDLEIKDAERRYNEGKAPEAVREWQWARQNGLTTAKSPVAYAKETAEATRQDSAPTVRQLKQADGSEVAVQWNPETKTWDPLAAPQGGEAVRPTGTKLTEGQSKDLIYHSRGLQALEAFEPLSGAYANGLERVASQVPGGNYVVSEEFQMAKQAGRNFLASVLRKDTGAAVTPSEEVLYGDIFLPQPGDKPGTLAQKSEARKQAIDAIRGGMGTAEVLALGKRLTSRQPGQDAPAKPDRPAQPQAAPPSAAADHLRANPGLRDQFDQKYGAGAAARILGQ